MIASIVALLGGWRATAFAAAALSMAICFGGALLRLDHVNDIVVQLRADAATLAAATAAAARDAEAKARAIEQSQADAITKAADAYQRGKTDAKAVADTVAAGLRAGTVRLRHELAACGARDVSAAQADTGRADGAANVRDPIADAVAGAIALGHACDVRVTALQAILQAERQ